jgi:hypothetical protein
VTHFRRDLLIRGDGARHFRADKLAVSLAQPMHGDARGGLGCLQLARDLRVINRPAIGGKGGPRRDSGSAARSAKSGAATSSRPQAIANMATELAW